MTIKEIIISRQNQILKTEWIQRKKYFDEIMDSIWSKPIKIISWFRRVGKSFLVKQIAKSLVIKWTVKLNNILYLNFEDYELMEYSNPNWITSILEVFNTNIVKDGYKIIILDEIQVLQNWNKIVRTLYEKWEYEIILTGSNSQLLSSEIWSNLAWRFIEFHILPFEFSEVLDYSWISIKNENDFFRKKPEIIKLWDQYLSWWWLPEIIEIKNTDTKSSYLKWVIEKVILDDIVKRFGIRQIADFEKILYFIFSCIWQDISIVNIVNKFISISWKNITANQVIKYISNITKSFCLYTATKFDWKLNKIFNDIKKYYATDLWLINILHQNNKEKIERSLENSIFLYLKKYFWPKVEFIWGNSLLDIDFLVKNNNEFIKIQVCYQLNEQNKKREVGNLIKTKLNGKNIIIYLENKLKENVNNIQIINILDLFMWLDTFL